MPSAHGIAPPTCSIASWSARTIPNQNYSSLHCNVASHTLQPGEGHRTFKMPDGANSGGHPVEPLELLTTDPSEGRRRTHERRKAPRSLSA